MKAAKKPICLLIVFLAAQTLQIDKSPAQTTTLWRDGDSSEVDPDLDRLGRAFIRLAEKVQPAVVQVRSYADSKQDKDRPRTSRGSGFI
ncbi:MAG: hypothetical protein ACREQW_02575, partial [Candidatus Binatia bacterium]